MPEESGAKNVLYYGDNLDILHRYIDDESIDLVYLDPPFKSNQDYNVLFQERNGSRAAAQVKAFEDTWLWDTSAASAFHDVVERGGRVADALVAFERFLGQNDMLAYLSMMAPRLVELRRVLKPTGSLYLHCDPTASHYLKMLLDAVFGPTNFRNEIIWRRSHPHGNVYNTYGAIHDTILFYSKGDEYTWNKPHRLYHLPDGSLDPEIADEVLAQYGNVEEKTGRRFQATSLLNPNPDRPNLTYEFHGITKVWRWTKERMEQAEREGRIYFPKGGEGIPREKRYLDEQEGFPLQDIWTDVPPIPAQADERLGYPTQKPEALLERIIRSSTNEGDVVLDPFCGCGTTVAVSQRLKRRWVGIDITHLAIALMKHRLKTAFGDAVSFTVVGEPVSLPDARTLAHDDPWQFQWWALGLVGARPIEQKKGSDKGIDGRLYFFPDRSMKGDTQQIIFSVKAGGVTGSQVRDLRGVIEREKAAIGVLLTMEPPTGPMTTEAASAGFYVSGELGNKKYPRLQILTIEQLLNGKRVDCPPFAAGKGNVTFKKAPQSKIEDKAKTKASSIHEFDSDDE